MIRKCARCGDVFTNDELAEPRSMGEEYWSEKGLLLCPDCYDEIKRVDPLEAMEKFLREEEPFMFEW